jgi:hypothetical protein
MRPTLAGERHDRSRTDCWNSPSSPIGLADVLSNFLVVHGSARWRGITVPAFAEDDRNLRTAEKLLGTAAALNARCLTEGRQTICLFGTCRDFALPSASRLREGGVPVSGWFRELPLPWPLGRPQGL